MGWGFGLDAQDGRLITNSGVVKEHVGNTNNVAEYYALGFGIKGVLDLLQSPVAPKFTGLHIRGDSNLVVNQVNSLWQVKSPHLGQLHGRILQLLAECGQPWVIEWIPREQNQLADQLSRRAFFEATGRHAKEWTRVKA